MISKLVERSEHLAAKAEERTESAHETHLGLMGNVYGGEK